MKKLSRKKTLRSFWPGERILNPYFGAGKVELNFLVDGNEAKMLLDFYEKMKRGVK